ncbi:MAG: TIGR03621 family F420-dependent LLM class oxidoreductase [Microthrixaceae bacterium]|nr:TIGR03621 family F420-dependent LLM class oxidoreductase [Microthrixaceae bacterium]
MTEPPLRRPFRFSSPATGCNTRRELIDRAKLLEDLGYSAVTIADHFNDQLGPIATLMAIADATTSIRIAPMVFSNDYRHPAALAKEAATLDLLSEGRLEFGLGAGWKASDYATTGITFDDAVERIDRMAESLSVIKALWAEGPAKVMGRWYQVDGLEGTPKPFQKPHPPITVGGGSKRVIQLAGREADIVGFIPSMKAGVVDAQAGPSATPAATDRRLEWLRDAAGDRFEHLELQVRLELALVTDDPDPLFETMSGAFGLTPDEGRETPYALVGPTDHMVEQLERRRDRWGFSYIGVPLDAADALAPVVARLAGN